MGRLEGRGIEKGRKVDFRGITERGTAELLQRRHVQSTHGPVRTIAGTCARPRPGTFRRSGRWPICTGPVPTTAPEVLENRTWVAVLDRPP